MIKFRISYKMEAYSSFWRVIMSYSEFQKNLKFVIKQEEKLNAKLRVFLTRADGG